MLIMRRDVTILHMKSLRTASFWIAAVVLPGGVLLLTPMAVRAMKRLHAKFTRSALTGI